MEGRNTLATASLAACMCEVWNAPPTTSFWHFIALGSAFLSAKSTALWSPEGQCSVRRRRKGQDRGKGVSYAENGG